MNFELKQRIVTSLILISLLTLMFLYSFIMITALVIIAMIVWVEFYAMISKILKKNSIKDKFLRYLFKSISLIYLSFLVYLLFSIEAYYLDLKIYLLYSVLVAILSDIGGLIIGRTFKGKKLTKISPNKTISGSIGSYIFSLLVISTTSQLGDLFISYLKRKAKVKDTSDILPGHGGFLDRVDGIIFAIPTGIILFKFF